MKRAATLLLIALGACTGVAAAAEAARRAPPDPEYCARRDANPEKCVIQDGPPPRPIVRKKRPAQQQPPVPKKPAEQPQAKS